MNRRPVGVSAGDVLSGDVRAAARLMRDLDDGSPSAIRVLKSLQKAAGRAYILGVTGPPGVGKSTLADRIVSAYRKKKQTVGVVAVDPTSPRTGGALLADRVRMQGHSLDDGVFIRSLATRGHLGGLTRSAVDIVTVMDAMGKDVILVETVGVGQGEVEVGNVAHTTLVVTAPGLFDDLQAIKAGILEIADIFVINKADREGAERTRRDLERMVATGAYGDGEWVPPVVTTVASAGTGIATLIGEVERHRAHVRVL